VRCGVVGRKRDRQKSLFGIGRIVGGTGDVPRDVEDGALCNTPSLISLTTPVCSTINTRWVSPGGETM